MLIFLIFLVPFSLAGEIKNLPGLNFELNFKQYSGYLNVTDTESLHYWFMESQNNPATDPLLFWFNGGPGCSSLMGAVSEIGPFFLNQDGETFQKNEYSWNKNASIVFIESPAAVGYSYTTNDHFQTDDYLNSLDNYQAIKEFFIEHPSFRNHSLFLTGESYGGIYLPMLAERIIDGQHDYPINLQGVAIGNGIVDWDLERVTIIEYLYGHGFIGDSEWKKHKSCLLNNEVEVCSGMFHLLRPYENTIDPYDISCDPTDQIKTPNNPIVAMMSLKTRFKKQIRVEKESNTNETIVSACINYVTPLENYFNKQEVREALHISSNSGIWETCSQSIKYNMSHNSVYEQVKKMVSNNVRTLLYYGDMDTICNFLMGQQFSANLGLPLIEDKKEWLYKSLNGGSKTEYKNLTFLTIRGAGHMAPRNKPAKMLHVIQNFIANTEI